MDNVATKQLQRLLIDVKGSVARYVDQVTQLQRELSIAQDDLARRKQEQSEIETALAVLVGWDD